MKLVIEEEDLRDLIEKYDFYTYEGRLDSLVGVYEDADRVSYEDYATMVDLFSLNTIPIGM